MTESQVNNHCFRTALRLLGRRDHSAAELVRKLQGRGFGRDIVEAVMAECMRLNYIDDRKFTQNYVRALKEKGFGVLRVTQMLRSKGIGEELIAAVQEEQADFEEQCAHCRRVVQKKRRVMTSHRDPARQKAALYRFLMGRGFGAEVAGRVLHETFAQSAGEGDE